MREVRQNDGGCGMTKDNEPNWQTMTKSKRKRKMAIDNEMVIGSNFEVIHVDGSEKGKKEKKRKERKGKERGGNERKKKGGSKGK